MMNYISRGLQFAGLAVPPLAIAAQMTNSITVGDMLKFLVAAICFFGIGRIMQGMTKPS